MTIKLGYLDEQVLIRAKTMMNPLPERIIWCCKRWQPLFSEMQSTIKNILFMPANLNDDSFIDTGYYGLFVASVYLIMNFFG
jgi:hypothetical protein